MIPILKFWIFINLYIFPIYYYFSMFSVYLKCTLLIINFIIHIPLNNIIDNDNWNNLLIEWN